MPSKVAFEERIKQLLAFEAEHGHLIVPASNGNLGGWCRSVRRGLCKISDDEKTRLDEIGFLFDVPKGNAKDEMIQWCKSFKMLVSFKKAKNHCNVPLKVAGKPYPLATWCDEQRELYGNGKLDQGKIDKLNRLGFDFFGTNDGGDDEPVSLKTKASTSCVMCTSHNSSDALKSSVT